jgi:hypothetical protein
MKCQRNGCESEATHYPEVAVAPYGYPITRGIKMAIRLELCFHHAHKTKATDLLGEEGKQQLRDAVKATTRSLVPLDFSRTRVTPHKLGDATWRKLTEDKS